MPNQFVPPSTPPRVSKPHKPMVMRTPSTFQPVTPVKITESFATPYTGGKNTRNLFKGSTDNKNKANLVPLTPEFTPQRSPHRSHKRKRSTVDAIFKQPTVDSNAGTETPMTDLSGLLMPTPSTVGTGRKVAHNHTRPLKPPVLSFETLSKLNDNLNFEEEVDDDDVFKASTPQLESGFIQNTNLKLSTNELSPVDASPIKKKPSVRKGLQTPKGQVIDDKTVNRWHGNSFNSIFSSDDEDYEEIKPMKMENPFLSSSAPAKKLNRPSNPFNNAKRSSQNGDVDYATQVEYFNTKTGARKVVNLLNRQREIKPKRLDFSSATGST
ncbi:unnamed protein product [Debaryomyces tyrocola]|nr:unnamed protein product [Debaryomyces tyrocola]